MHRRDVLIGGAGLTAAAFTARIAAAVPKSDAGAAHALVISLGYDETPQPLLNTRNDGALIVSRLNRLGFGSVDHLQDPGEAVFAARLQAFAARLQPGALAFVYYAGHAAQIAGVNYLLMADGQTFISMQSLITTLRGASDTVVMLLDACRNDPRTLFDGNGGRAVASRSIKAAELGRIMGADKLGYTLKALRADAGISRIGAVELQGTGIRIVYATDPNNVAADGANIFDRNSPFAAALARRLLERRSLDDVISLATGDVVAATGGAQSPWSQGSIGRPIFLAGPPENKNPAKVPFQVPG